MKKTIIFALFASLFASCGEDFLEKNPLGQESNRTFYTTEGNCEYALNAVYDPAGWYETYAINYWVYGDVCSDDTEKGGESPADQVDMQNLMTFNHNSGNPLLLNTWKGFYIGIARANELIYRTESVEFSEKLRLRFRGEARFLRALYYFDLTRIFGAVPLVTEPVNPGEGSAIGNRDGGATLEDQRKYVMDFVIEELNAISEDLPWTHTGDDRGRASKASVLGLLTRAYAYTENWAMVQSTSAKLIAEYPTLTVNYQDIFSFTNENNAEILFSVQATDDDYGRNAEGTERSTYQNVRYLRQASGAEKFLASKGYGFNLPRKSLYESFENGDPRLDMILREGVNDSVWWFFETEPIAKYKVNFRAGQSTGAYCRKSTLERTQISVAKDQSSGLDIPLIRLAEVYLYAAEASYKLGDEATALKYVNLVRQRARNSARKETGYLTYVPTTSTVPADLPSITLDLIYKEQRLEMFCEGTRFFELVRTGQVASVMAGVTSDVYGNQISFVPGKNEYFPIPASEITRHTGGNLIQNPGY